MVSLLAWRATCRANFIMVNDELRLSLEALAARFFPNPTTFLEMLVPWSGLVVGEAALSHVLRDPSICKTSLEIAIGNLYFHPFLDSLSRLLPYGTVLDTRVVKPTPHGFSFHRHINRVAEYRLMSGLFVIVYESCTPSACDVVSRYWTTALMNFVTARTLGCAYPRLTLNNLTLICDARSSSMDWADHAMARTLVRLGFQTDTHSLNWPLYAWGPDSSPPTVEGCGRDLYVCPYQGRFFGDGGSLVVFQDGFRVDFKELQELSVAPYGPMVTWRLPSSGLCEGRCSIKDKVLPSYVVSMLSMFVDGSSGRPHLQLLMPAVSDGRSSITSRVTNCGRRYSI